MSSTEFDSYPLVVALGYYMTVFVVAEYETAGTLSFYLLMEVIATAQMCTCVYENALIIRHYGLLGFFFAVTLLIFSGGIMNREAYVSPLIPIELYYKGTLSAEKLLTIIAGEMIGGYSAYAFARHLWYWSLNLSADHAFFLENPACKLTYKVGTHQVPFIFVPSFEVIGCFLMRYILRRIPPNLKIYMVPTVISSFLTFASLFIGVPGLNPTIVSSRLQGCEGLSTIWFILTYWICPIIGWMLSVFMDKPEIAVTEKKTE
ncbi:unnamed protein product [Onchocerca flexuosa]|uniref:Aquaporin n=1 Tax=Onchocerca flexuosa TaxID=387005 RepID=A0A183H1Q8_9BILA|nr:unnamed protein product [Onchocerca flexuosa]